MEPLRILLVDDSSLFRKGLVGLFASVPDMVIVGEARDGMEAVEQARELMPDVILMDILMPRQNGVEATRHIKEEMPSIRVVMLTVSESDEHLFESIKAGAHGYLLKNLEPEQLFHMLRVVAQGEAPGYRSRRGGGHLGQVFQVLCRGLGRLRDGRLERALL